jgi:NADP-dependent 3-hydroxy acid dehydrogenase YdfG
VLITGASSGIGRPTAREFRARGWTVFGTARAPHAIRPDDRVDGLTCLPLDYRDRASIQAITETLPRIDALVNNAGIGQAGAVEDQPTDAAQELFEVNVFGPLELTRAYLPAMRAASAGTIVFVGSLIAELPYRSKAITPRRNWPCGATCNPCGTSCARTASVPPWSSPDMCAPASVPSARGWRRCGRGRGGSACGAGI